MVEIKNRFSDSVICSGETIRECVIANKGDLRVAYLRSADLRVADLRGAYLRGADLRGADLRGAYLRSADLRVADLRGADLRGADLIGADLSGADLIGADLRGACLSDADGSRKTRLAWQSRDLLSEILRRAAGDDLAKMKVAGLILIQRHWCWSDFLKLDDPLSGWAMGVLAEWVQDDDGAPEELRRIAESESRARRSNFGLGRST